MNKEYIERNCTKFRFNYLDTYKGSTVKDIIDYVPTANVVEIPEAGIGDLSDGYHTFNELYHHRAILFSVICNAFPEKAWKSKKHHEGDMFEGMFIVGIETSKGQATYHYNIEPYWDMFKVKELDIAPLWDGHSADDAIARISTLTDDSRSEWVFEGRSIHCKECGFTPSYSLNKENSKFCPGCGKEMK